MKSLVSQSQVFRRINSMKVLLMAFTGVKLLMGVFQSQKGFDKQGVNVV